MLYVDEFNEPPLISNIGKYTHIYVIVKGYRKENWKFLFSSFCRWTTKLFLRSVIVFLRLLSFGLWDRDHDRKAVIKSLPFQVKWSSLSSIKLLCHIMIIQLVTWNTFTRIIVSQVRLWITTNLSPFTAFFGAFKLIFGDSANTVIEHEAE